MNNDKKKKEETNSEDSEDKDINELAEAVLNHIHVDSSNNSDPFELYSQKMRSQLHSNVNEFHSRFVKGYKVLLEELHKQKF
jgi:hypothetical protein